MKFARKAGFVGWLYLATAANALAQLPGGGTNPSPGGGQNPGGSITITNPLGCDSVLCVTQAILSALFQISIPIVSLMVLVGAFQIMFAAGNPEKVSTGRKTIIYAVVGFLIILLASSIVPILKEALGA